MEAAILSGAAGVSATSIPAVSTIAAFSLLRDASGSSAKALSARSYMIRLALCRGELLVMTESMRAAVLPRPFDDVSIGATLQTALCRLVVYMSLLLVLLLLLIEIFPLLLCCAALPLGVWAGLGRMGLGRAVRGEGIGFGAGFLE